MFDFFADMFGYVLNWIYLLVKNYGVAIILFSVVVKIAMIPISINQQKSLKNNAKLQKEMDILKVKYKGNEEKLNQEMMNLYKNSKINPFGGCLNIILQFILIISMFMLVKSPITYMKKIKDENVINAQIETIKQENGENSFSTQYPEMSIIKYLQSKNLEDNEMYINMNFLGLDLSKVPQENLTDITVYIIPVLYIVSSYISMKITSQNPMGMKQENSEDEKNEENKNSTAEMTQQMNKTMLWMIPILSVTVSIVAPLGLALYWLINNILMTIERVILNKVMSTNEE